MKCPVCGEAPEGQERLKHMSNTGVCSEACADEIIARDEVVQEAKQAELATDVKIAKALKRRGLLH